MSSTLQQQFTEARTKYPSFKQVSQFEFDVKIGSSSPVVYTIKISQNYPNDAPTIRSPNGVIMTALTNYWQPIFTFCDIIEYLAVYAGFAAPMKYAVTKQEVVNALGSAGYNNVTDKDARDQIIKSMPTVKKAKMESDKSKSRHEKAERKIVEDEDKLFSLQEELSKQIAINQTKLQRVDQMRVDPQQIQVMSIRNKIAQLRSEIQQKETQIENLKSQFASKSIKVEQYAKSLLNAKESIKKNQAICDELQRMVPK